MVDVRGGSIHSKQWFCNRPQRFLGLIQCVFAGVVFRDRQWTSWTVSLASMFFCAVSNAAQPTVEYAMGLAPFQKNVDYDRPAASEAKESTIKMEKQGSITAWVVRGPRGDVLRSFADTNGDRVVDRWSYFKNGVEVYRDVDSNFNAKADEHRWLNTAGSRFGVDENEDGNIDRWKSMSAEEATSEIVEAIKYRDEAAFGRLLPTKAEIDSLGLSGDRLADVERRVDSAKKAFVKTLGSQKKLSQQTQWNNMLAPIPGMIPLGTDGSTKDVVAYDNVMALVEDGGQGGQIFIGSLVRFGDVWRPIDAPQLPGAEIVDLVGVLSFGMIGRGTPESDPGSSEKLKPLLVELRDIESKFGAAGPEARPALAEKQSVILGKIVLAAEPEEREFWVKQMSETLASAVQENVLPSGIELLEKLVASLKDEESLQSFAKFRLASARYAVNMQGADADIDKAQRAWLEELRKFIEEHPSAPDTPEAMLQIAISEEFSGNEQKAVELYDKIVADFSLSSSARKATGASKRLQSVGTILELSGTSLDGKSIDLASLRGTPVLIHYWATWCEPCKVDISQIKELSLRYGNKKLAVVGIALDSDKGVLEKYLKSKPIPWIQLHEPGGLDGRLAEMLGVLTLPTMLLLDSQGKVVDRNVGITELEKKIEAILGGD